MTKNLTIIIVTFNSSEVIANCLSKLNVKKYDVIVVDNASTDNTVEIVLKNFSDVKIIKSEKNIGYGRANNIALRQIKTEFSLILNPDAFIFEEDIDKALEVMQQDEKVALLGPLLLTKYPKSKQDIEKQMSVVNGNLIKKNSQYLSVKYIIGAVLFLKMSVFKEIGFFDEEIFLYYEDDEISWKVIKNGYKAVILPNIFGFHIGHGSSGSNLRSIYKRFWHRSLSKLYWKKKQKGSFIATKSAIRLVILFLFKSILSLITLNLKNAVKNLASCFGSIAFLFNIKAFDKNGNARG